MEYKGIQKAKYFKLGVVVGVACVLLACLGSFAWFRGNRQLYTFAHVQRPSTLAIMGERKTAIDRIDLSDVDLASENPTKWFVFCVNGTNAQQNYDLELAFTTNVPFTYNIYKSSETTQEPTDDYAEYTEEGITYYYPKGVELTGRYINNANDTGNPLADVTPDSVTNKHADAYENYTYVQQRAEPVYLLFKNIAPGNPVGGSSEYVDYYILELSWDQSLDKSYDKETDLVYLLAENSEG